MNAFLTAYPLRTRADVPWGMTLSGGIDSSAIAGLLRQQQGDKAAIHAFSVVYPQKGISEKAYQEAVLQRHALLGHTIAPDWVSFLRHLDDVLMHQDEPIASTAVVSHRVLMKTIREAGIKVALNGQGADEILAGYDKFFLPWMKETMRQNPWRLPLELIKTGLLKQWHPADALHRLQQYGKTSTTLACVNFPAKVSSGRPISMYWLFATFADGYRFSRTAALRIAMP
ncbi:MAG: asparagine synthase C-terminal domain-containing protein [Saprospiraceae bacterium]